MSDQFDGGSGHAPMPGEPPSSPVGRGPAPEPVANAVRLMFVRAALGVLGVLLVLATKTTLKSEIVKRNPTADSAKLDSLLNTALAVGVVIGLVFIVLYVLLALKVRDGRNWARIVTWVLAGLGVLGGLAALAQPEPALSRVVSVISAALDVVIIVLLAQRPASRYFADTP